MAPTSPGHTAPPPALPSEKALSLLDGLLRDAVQLAERGTAGRADIDLAMRLGAGHPQGPFEILASLTGAEPPATDAPVPSAAAWSGPVGVVGAGAMAAGIAESVARSGRAVRVLARTQTSADRLRVRVAGSLERAQARGRLAGTDAGAVLDRIQADTATPVLAGTEVVIEAVAEDLEVKAGVLADLDRVLPPETALATNTSSYTVDDVMTDVSSGRPVLALHFFNPAPVMRLVEVVTDEPRLAETARAWVRDLGKTPVSCADHRGFVVNRLLIPFLNDAVRLHENGAPVDEVDAIAREGARHPMGPLALIDLIGIDVTVAALEAMAQTEPDPRLTPAPALLRLRAQGRLGRKTGGGFHDYT